TTAPYISPTCISATALRVFRRLFLFVIPQGSAFEFAFASAVALASAFAVVCSLLPTLKPCHPVSEAQRSRRTCGRLCLFFHPSLYPHGSSQFSSIFVLAASRKRFSFIIHTHTLAIMK